MAVVQRHYQRRCPDREPRHVALRWFQQLLRSPQRLQPHQRPHLLENRDGSQNLYWISTWK
jgi:hypothetical protein